MKRARYVLMVLSGKGGVGKTTVAVNLASALAHGHRVGLLDADLHGPNVPKMLGLEGATLRVQNNKILPAVTPDNLLVVSLEFALPSADAPVIWRGPLKMKAIQQFVEDVDWGELDLLVVDLPPGTGDEPLSVAAPCACGWGPDRRHPSRGSHSGCPKGRELRAGGWGAKDRGCGEHGRAPLPPLRRGNKALWGRRGGEDGQGNGDRIPGTASILPGGGGRRG